jgi:hypothetical protein
MLLDPEHAKGSIRLQQAFIEFELQRRSTRLLGRGHRHQTTQWYKEAQIHCHPTTTDPTADDSISFEAILGSTSTASHHLPPHHARPARFSPHTHMAHHPVGSLCARVTLRSPTGPRIRGDMKTHSQNHMHTACCHGLGT